MKNINYNRPEMEIIMLDSFDNVVTVSPGADDGKTPSVDFEEIWGTNNANTTSF